MQDQNPAIAYFSEYFIKTTIEFWTIAAFPALYFAKRL
jgi:hypothetical protein